jgi:Condensation domain/AMP-binding enzyme C-terminal domain
MGRSSGPHGEEPRILVNLETEVESAVLRFTDVRAASAFVWRGKLMGFVQPATVNLEELRVFMKENFDPFVVPDEILALDQCPLTAHGKVDRAALHARLEDRMAKEDADLDIMECTSPYDALRLAFTKCLQVPFRDLDRTSSFSRLGGNSLAAIRLSKFLRQQGYAITILHILREDTIDHLEEKLTKINEENGAPDSNGTVQTESEAVPATDMHRLMLAQSQRNPVTNCLLVRAKFVGGQDSVPTPTPSELQVAWTATLAAHGIFKTRYDMQSWTLHDLDRVNLDWEEVSVEAEGFDNALLSVEEQVWTHHKNLQSPSLEVPYCHMTCIYAPSRKAIGFVWRIHHVLIDIFSYIIFMRDLEQALAKKKVAPGPRIQDFSRFMQKYKDDKLVTATEYWKRMMKPLCERSLFDFRPPQTSFEGNAWRSLPFTTRETEESIEASVRTYNISSSTLIFAAWALVLSKYTRCSLVSFYLSRSGRMLPWPLAPSLVAAMNCRVPFATGNPAEATVHEWLAEMHSTLLSVAELENLCQSLDRSIYPEEYFKTGVQAFLYMPQLPASWEVHDKLTGQADQIGMVWRVQPTGNGAVEAELDIDQRVVDIEWAKEVGTVAVRMLEGLANAQRSTKLRNLNLNQ